MVCPVCAGEGYLRREIDTTAVYGVPMKSMVSRPCPNCLGSGEGELPLSGKDQAAGGGIGDGGQDLQGGVTVRSGELTG